jgi:uncharacterized protein YbjT (DUF2867 family)
MIEIAGPERLRLSELVAHYLKATNDLREVISDPQATISALASTIAHWCPANNAQLGAIRFEDWLRWPTAA